MHINPIIKPYIMKKYVSIALIIFLGCKSEEEKRLDRLDSLKNAIQVNKMTDSLISKVKSQVRDDNYKKSIKNCPVKIDTSYIFTGEYSNLNIAVSIKNSTSKTIDGIKVSWDLYNNFDEYLADDGGITQKILLPGKKEEYSWRLSESTATKAKPYIYSIHYSDGTVWNLNQ